MIFFLRALNVMVFSACIVVQWNDPDPLVWSILYVVPIFWTVFPPDSTMMKYLMWCNASCYLLGALLFFPSDFQGISGMKDNIPEIEEAREALGLLLASFGIVITSQFGEQE